MPNTRFAARLGCSSISFRHQPLAEALATITSLGFDEIDLGALPGVCDHVPFVLDSTAVADVARTVAASGLRVRSVNGDVGDLNAPAMGRRRSDRRAHLDTLSTLAAAVGARALVLPCGALDHEPITTLEADIALVADELATAAAVAASHGVELWTESLHLHRLCWNVERAQMLADRLVDEVGIVMDFSHVVASGGDPVDFVARFGPRIAHVHVRDATPGNINVSVGNGHVDFACGIKELVAAKYQGHYSLELETRDITHDQRPDAAARAGDVISNLI
ncbi:sugar phosphate isomerase/epimerase [Mycobacterium hodleri]|uniref:sugar phosphate isomerase/epimerase family protein n=1 Tax=Mycolicibacterium hodleri TaxID=49897 RepID=UPI0021F35313|nr:sugar phosphate isomerase/epimerase [Mycolicibacterium hodleri]MCV7132350.1 sugar phosphate isomerase/epimerase [Mycolicibacterium hodleri]